MPKDGYFIPLTLRDCFTYQKDVDGGWGCTYRVIQSMEKNIFNIEPHTLEFIVDKIEGKQYKEWLEPLDGKIYFDQRQENGVTFRIWKYEKHAKWRSETSKVSRLEKYEALETDSLGEFLMRHFNQPGAKMLMFDDGVYTIGVHGYKNGIVYAMDPHDWSGIYL